MKNYGATKAIIDKNLVVLIGDQHVSYQTPEENGLLIQGSLKPLYTLGVGGKVYVVFYVVSSKFVGPKCLLVKQFTNQITNHLPPGVIANQSIWKKAAETLLSYYNPPHYEVNDFGMQPTGVCVIPGLLIDEEKAHYFPTLLNRK